MRLFKFICILVLFFFFSQICFAKILNLKFSILLEKSAYKWEEPINVTFKLENKGKEPEFVNKRFYLNSEDIAKERRGEVVLKVISPSGKELPCKFSYETGLPKSDYFELLEPSKEIISEYPRNLRGYFSFEEPGVYKVAAVYQNIFGKEIGLDVFKDKLSSDSVSFKIIKE
jgi:hypothetical protein